MGSDLGHFLRATVVVSYENSRHLINSTQETSGHLFNHRLNSTPVGVNEIRLVKMPSCNENRSVPNEGATILLIEVNEGERTFSDYADQLSCLNNIVGMYEMYRASFDTKSEGDLKEFQGWIDDFYKLEMFVFERQISRYRQLNKDKIKLLFEEEEQQAESNNVPSQNGHAKTTKEEVSKEQNGYRTPPAPYDDIEDVDTEENWDD